MEFYYRWFFYLTLTAGYFSLIVNDPLEEVGHCVTEAGREDFSLAEVVWVPVRERV